MVACNWCWAASQTQNNDKHKYISTLVHATIDELPTVIDGDYLASFATKYIQTVITRPNGQYGNVCLELVGRGRNTNMLKPLQKIQTIRRGDEQMELLRFSKS